MTSEGTNRRPDVEPRVRHVVLVKFRNDITPEQRREFVERSQWGREAVYVSDVACGSAVQPNPYAGGRSEEWDWGMTLDLDQGDVERYRDDPVHRAVGADVGHYAERLAILDFIIDR